MQIVQIVIIKLLVGSKKSNSANGGALARKCLCNVGAIVYALHKIILVVSECVSNGEKAMI